MLNKQSKIFVAGHRGMVGSAIIRNLTANGYVHLICRDRSELDLTNQAAVNDFFKNESIDVVLLAAARAGGILANNTYRAEFIYQNLMIQSNVIHGAYRAGIEKLLFLGSSCIYPKQCPQPMKETHLLSGYLEPTNAPYAISKIAGIIQCDSYNRQYGTRYRVLMPTNLYGINDNYDLFNSHVLPALIRKFHLAKLSAERNTEAILEDEARFGPIPEDFKRTLLNKQRTSNNIQEMPRVTLWGSGTPKREFLHADDLAEAIRFVMNMSDGQYEQICELESDGPTELRMPHLNLGSGKDRTIKELAETIKHTIGFSGEINWDLSKPDGPQRKLLDSTRLFNAGWRPKIGLKDGISAAYEWYKSQTS